MRPSVGSTGAGGRLRAGCPLRIWCTCVSGGAGRPNSIELPHACMTPQGRSAGLSLNLVKIHRVSLIIWSRLGKRRSKPSAAAGSLCHLPPTPSLRGSVRRPVRGVLLTGCASQRRSFERRAVEQGADTMRSVWLLIDGATFTNSAVPVSSPNKSEPIQRANTGLCRRRPVSEERGLTRLVDRRTLRLSA